MKIFGIPPPAIWISVQRFLGFHPHYLKFPTETPAHVYVQSVHNIAVELSWLRLCLEFGDKTVIVFKQGEDNGIYLAHIPEHAYIFFW